MENEYTTDVETIDAVVDTCLNAGRVMMECGAEVYRVEDTLQRIAKVAGYHAEVYVTLTGIFVNIKQSRTTQFIGVQKRTINLEKVAKVNEYSRMYAMQELSLDAFCQAIQKIDTDVANFSLKYRLLSAGIVSSTLMILFGGHWLDFAVTFLIGLLGYWFSDFIHQKVKINYFDSFLGAGLIGFLTAVLVAMGWIMNRELVTLGAVMPLVPGVAITNSFRDVLAGHLLSGMARGAEAVIVAAMIGLGIVIGQALI